MLRFACLQSCVPKDIYKGFTWINGGRPEGQHCAGLWGSSPEWVAGSTQSWVPLLSALCRDVRAQHKWVLLFLWANTAPVPWLFKRWDQETLASFWGRIHYSMLGFLFLRWGLPFLPQLWSGWIANWDIQLAPAALASETTRSLRLNKYELSCSSSSITKFWV